MSSRRGHGEGSIFQRADGRWSAVVDLGWADGRRQRKTLYGRTRREVADKLKAAQRAQEQGTLAARDERRSVAQYLEWWLRDVAAPELRPASLRGYEVNVRCHIVPALGQRQLSKLSPADVTGFVRTMQAKGVKPRTIQYAHAVLRRALADAERFGYVSRNVARLVRPPRVVHDEVVPFTTDEARLFLAEASQTRLYALYAVALALGLRQGEALGLRWQDVDLDGKNLRVREALQFVEGQATFVPPKSARSKRSLALPDVCVDALRAHRVRQIEERLAAGQVWHDHGLVFTTSIGTPIHPRNHARDFVALCMKAGLGHRRLHDLRHTCASLLLAQNVHPRTVMEVLGHSQFSLTMNTYAHVMPQVMRDAAEQMDLALDWR